MCDILICSLPVSTLNHAPAAPALLKSCVEQAGFTAKTLDLSQIFYIKISNKDFLQYNEDSKFLLPNHEYDALSESKIRLWLSQSVEQIKSVNPKYIGLSIFSYFMQRSAYLLSIELRKHCPNIKIILGGYGVTQPASSLKNLNDFKTIDLIKPFNQFMKEQQLVDYTIIGEGEEALVNILEQNENIANDNTSDLYNVPTSNFDDYNLQDYEYVNNVLLPVTGSKGCVRQCTFCDIPNKFGKFRFRSGKHIAKEILYLKQRYNINNFAFTDSLINGSLKALKELLVELANYNNSVQESERIRWSGQYISRPKGQTPEYIYELMSQSGAEGLTIGMESGSNAVLEAMNKKVKIEDVNYEMQLFEKYNISTVLLFIIGFYNETYENFLETLNIIIDYQKYVASGTVIRMELGIPLAIYAETALYHTPEITVDPINPYNWKNVNNTELTFKERVRRRLIAQVVCDELGIPTGMTTHNLNSILNTIDE